MRRLPFMHRLGPEGVEILSDVIGPELVQAGAIEPKDRTNLSAIVRHLLEESDPRLRGKL